MSKKESNAFQKVLQDNKYNKMQGHLIIIQQSKKKKKRNKQSFQNALAKRRQQQIHTYIHTSSPS